MLHDWNHIDFDSIKEQASWIVLCRENIFESGKTFKSYFYSFSGRKLSNVFETRRFFRILDGMA